MIYFPMKSEINFYPIRIDLVFKKQTRYIIYFCDLMFNFLQTFCNLENTYSLYN